jgi:hypothetical protein
MTEARGRPALYLRPQGEVRSGPHLSGCSSRRPSRNECVNSDGPRPGPSAGGGSVSDTRGSHTRSRGTGTPSVPSLWGRAGW